MKGVVTRKSPYGFKIEGNEDWMNISKFDKSKPLDLIKVGDEVEFEQNAKGYVEGLTVVSSSALAKVENKPATTKTTSTGSGFSAEKDAKITRLSVLSTVFGEPFKALVDTLGTPSRAIPEAEASCPKT